MSIKKYIFTIKKYFKTIEVKRYCEKNKIFLTQAEIDDISENITTYPKYNLFKIIECYYLNRATDMVKEYLPHQQRVIDEHKELLIKFKKLDEFIDKPGFVTTVSNVEQTLLLKQWSIMEEYIEVLEERIQLF